MPAETSSNRNNESQLDEEIQFRKESRSLNNFCGLLPGGYRRSPGFKNFYLDRPDDPNGKELFRQFEIVDGIITILGFNPEDIIQMQQKLGEMVRIVIEWKIDPREIDYFKVKDEFFDKYEFPIWEKLRRTYPAEDGTPWTA